MKKFFTFIYCFFMSTFFSYSNLHAIVVPYGTNQLNIAIVGKDKDLSQEVINRLCKFAQKADGYDDIFLVRSRSGRHFGIKFYNIAESGLEAISECHYAFCPFNLVNPNLENTITELDNLKELIKSKNYLCDITFIPICNSSMSEEENRTCIETINQYAVSCEKEHRWDGIQDFNSVYLGKDEKKLIPALLENIAEWGNIRINDFRSKFGKSPTVLRQPNFSKGFCSETEPKAKVCKETKVNSVKDIQPKPDSISLSFDDIFDDELKKIFITQIQQAVNSEYTVESIKALLGNFKFKNGIRGGRFEFAEYLKKSKLKSNK